ncbi:putative bifunctional diguanylate cyclase/phosphodiesterase [Hydrogenophilus thiooxidans]|uniref:putative bifunctional diguanylate cyclase/phosphodiesterase n=1 Tax=Hydrogenophilus thiooxidans TaxID=2820326 RepID=UPI001C22812F|nr:GGDEF and EAL domain-containing protein [Hydrogenophilus thiooxidans]
MKRPPLRRSLFFRWVPLLLLGQLAILTALGLFFWYQAQNAAQTLVLDRLTTLQVELRAALQEPLLARNLPTLEEIATELAATAEIDYLAVFDAAGQRLALAGHVPHSELPEGQPLATLKHRSATLLPRYDVLLPLTSGAVQVGYSPQPLLTWLTTFTQTGLAAVVAATLFALLLYLVFFLRVSHRLGVIEATANHLAAGDRHVHAPEGDSDEIARLGRAFNRMAREIADQLTQRTIAEREMEATLAVLEAEHAQFTALLEAMRLGVLLVDTQNQILFANTALRRLWHIPPEAPLVGRNARDAMRASNTLCAEPDHFSKLLLMVPGTQEISDSTELHLIDGRILLQLFFPVRDSHQRLIGRLWLFEDITRERRSAEQLIYLAERDGLTGLYNRRRFAELLEEKLNEAMRNRHEAALLLFDIDEFKQLNDTFGHRAGDALLARIASELTTITRAHEIVARLGGDEFAVLIPLLQNHNEPQQLAERIIRTLARIPFEFDGQRIGVTVSLGVALFPEHGTTPDDLVVAADIAMYQAKNAGRNPWRGYRADASAASVTQLNWNQRLERALTESLFELHFQGIYRLDGTLAHVEALVRMRDPEEPTRLVAPAHFIPAAEKSGKIRDLDRWVITAALEHLSRHPEAPRIAVNISGRTLSDPGFLPWLESVWHAVPPHARRLLFEITETAAIGDLQEAIRFANQLHEMGAILCLDDFGTGFSSFSYLKYIPADIVKIDGQFIRDLPQDENNRLIVRAIAEVARGMGKTTIAEFVEDHETLTLLAHLGIDAVQGYYLGRPSPQWPASNVAVNDPQGAAPAPNQRVANG